MKRFLSLLTLIVSVLAGYHVLSIWKGVNLYQKDVTKERLLRSARLTSFNPDPYYRLGILYQWDIRNVDLNESLNYLKGAIERNPFEQEYWLNVARAFQRMGENGPFERALENAIHVYPTAFQGRWIAGNLFLQQGNIEKAIPQFSYLLANHPEQSSLVYNVWMNVVKSPDFILEKLIPKDPSSLSRYLSYLYQLREKVTAKKLWGMKISLNHRIERNEMLRHVDFLISEGEFHEAFQVWKARLREEKQPISYDGNLMTNGGFEKEEILGGGFDWKMQSVSGAQISSDHGVYYEGKSSLKIHFNGKENVDFQHVYQFVALKPNADYLLRAHMKTNGVTTKSGVKIEVVGIGSAFHAASESLTGDNAWKELTVSFHTPSQSQGGLVRVRREPTDKFDRFISGIVWIDDFRLTERKNSQ